MDASFHIRPFAFDRDFSAASAAASLGRVELELELQSLRTEIEAMRRDHGTAIERARSEGWEAGLAEARGEIEAALLAATDALQASLETVEDEIAAIAEQRTRDAAQVALAAADVMAARALETAPDATIEEAIDRVLQQVGRNPQLGIRVATALVERVEALIAERSRRERRRMTISVIADPALAPGDAYIFWDNGGLQLDAAARRAAIVEELGPLLGGE